MKEKLKLLWAKQKAPIKLIIGGVLIAVGIPAWLSTPATSIVYSTACTVIEAECD